MGILTGKFDKKPTFEGDDFRKAWIEDPDQNAQFLKDLESVDQLRAAIPNRPPAEVAIKFLMAHPAVSTAILGARNPRQVTQNQQSATAPPLTEAEQTAINTVIPPDGGRKIWPA